MSIPDRLMPIISKFQRAAKSDAFAVDDTELEGFTLPDLRAARAAVAADADRPYFTLLEDKIQEWDKKEKPATTSTRLPQNFIQESRLKELEEAGNRNKTFDFSQLITICNEVNCTYDFGCFFATAMLQRAILDHVPPLFKCKNFSEVANNYQSTSGSGQSFKKMMRGLDDSLRNLADECLHRQIGQKMPRLNANSINYSQALDRLLQEVIHLA